MDEEMRTAKGMAVVSGDSTHVRLVTGNSVNVPTPKGLKTGDRVWVFFTSKGIVASIEKITGHRLMEPELPEEDSIQSDPNDEEYTEDWGNDYRD